MAAETFRIEIPIDVKDNTDPGVSQATHKMNAFDRANQKTQERLNKMNRTKYQVVLDVIDKASSIIGKVSTKVRSVAGKTFSFSLKVLDLATAPLRGIWNFATSIQGAIFGTAGAWAGIVQPLKLAADFEQTQISLETMLGSAEKASKLISEIQTFAAQTPFEASDLMGASKTLLNYRISAEDVMDVMKQLGDVSLGNNEKFQALSLAYGQATSNGKLQGQDLLQMINAGWNPLNDIMKRTGETMEQVKKRMSGGGVSANELRQALADATSEGGMFYQAMIKQSKSLSGIIGTFKDIIQSKLLTKWGQGLAEGIKPTLLKAATWIDNNTDLIESWGDAWKKAGADISKWVMSKVEDLQSSIRRMTNSQEWKDAQTFGAKMKVAWDQIIARPFNEWWNSTGKAWLGDKANKIGEGLGTGLTAGLLALLGVDAKGTVGDGISIGASFAEGFKKGFDGKKVGKAILDAIKDVFKDAGTLLPGGEKASSTSWLSAGIITLALSKLGIFKLMGKGGKGLISLLGKGSKNGMPSDTGMPSDYITTTMSVSAQVVNIYGQTISSGGGFPTGGTSGTPTALPSGSPTLGAGRGAAGKAINTVKLGNGTYAASDGAVTTGLAKAGVALGSGATTAGGAAAAGASGILGGILGLLGIGSGIKDIYKGSKSTDAKEAKDRYWSGGTKLGMVGTGALIGTAIMPGLGTTIGAGIGGAGALFKGSKVGKTLSDATDKDGGITKFLEDAKQKAGDTWESIKNGASNTGSWISEKWGSLSSRFDSSVWEPVKSSAQTAGSWIGDKFTAAKGSATNSWSNVSGWFGETVWQPLKSGASSAGSRISSHINNAKTTISNAWEGFSGWFDKSVWEPVKSGASNAAGAIRRKWREAKTWFADLVKMDGKGSKDTGTKEKTNVAKHAYGGIMTKPHMGIVAEDGPESITPLSPSKRSRGIDLWQQTGKMLGIQAQSDQSNVVSSESELKDMPIAVPISMGQNTSGTTVKIEISANPNFTIEGSTDENKIVSILKSHIRDMTDDIGDELGERLTCIFKNMPMKGGA